MAICLALALAWFASDAADRGDRRKVDDLRIDAVVVNKHDYKQDETVLLKGSLRFKKSEAPSRLLITIWAGGKPGTSVVKAGQVVVFLRDRKSEKKLGEISWEGSIHANYSGDEDSYLEVVPLHGKSDLERYYGEDGKPTSWVEKIKIKKK